MGVEKVFIPLCITIEQYDVLLKAIDFYNYSSSIFEYGEHIEECQTLRNKIMRHLQPKEKFINYLRNERTEE